MLEQVSSKAKRIADWTFVSYGISTYDRVEMEHLAEAALSVPDGGLIAEIGVYSGCSASILLQAARGRDVTVLLCDTFAFMWDENAKERLKTTLETFPDVSLIDGMHRESEEAAALTGELVDLVHIDGDHSESGIERDCRVWLKKVKPGGLAAFHDYHGGKEEGRMCSFPGLVEVVDRYIEGWERVWEGGSYGLLIARKPE